MQSIDREIRLSIRHLELAGLAWGGAGDRPLLALHGWLDNAASFARLAPLLTGRELVALDLAGHGRSGHRPAGVPYHFVDYVPDVLQAADSLGWDRFDLLGHSLGAAIASFVAAVAPERIGRLALIEGLGPLTAPAGETADRLQASIRRRERQGSAQLPVYPCLSRAIDARHAAGDMDRDSARRLVERNTVSVKGGWTWRTDPRLRMPSPLFLTEEQVLASLARIGAPTLLVRASAGNLLDRDFMSLRYERVADLHLVDLPGRHHLHMDDPQPVARAVTGFLNP